MVLGPCSSDYVHADFVVVSINAVFFLKQPLRSVSLRHKVAEDVAEADDIRLAIMNVSSRHVVDGLRSVVRSELLFLCGRIVHHRSPKRLATVVAPTV